MKTFLRVFAKLVIGALHGYDRVVFRGHLRPMAVTKGMQCHMCANSILLKDFDDYVKNKTARLIEASLETAQRLGRPVEYLNSANIDKEKTALRIAAKKPINEGLICVLKCVEPCRTFEVHRNRERKLLELQSKCGRCSFLYHYYFHPVFGLMYGRIQTYFPFSIQIGINGREWLARQLDKEGLPYRRYDNKVTWVENWTRAQALLDAQLQENWPQRLDEIRKLIHPSHAEMMGRMPLDYYWSAFQTEWASDILFRSPADVRQVFAPMVRHAFLNFGSAQVMSFLGRKPTADGGVSGHFDGEVKSKILRRPEGTCIKHWVNGNSIKAYDGPGFIRLETTVNQPQDFKVYRTKENDPDGDMDWRVLRKGVADMYRRAEVCQAANDRYAEAYAAIKDTTPLKELVDPLCQRTLAPGKNPKRRMVRGLNPIAPHDAALLQAILDPKFAVAGLRNRDLVALLYPKPSADGKEKRRRSGRVTRLIRLLRGHRLLHKVPKSHRYQLSTNGCKQITALLAARNADAATLCANAA